MGMDCVCGNYKFKTNESLKRYYVRTALNIHRLCLISAFN
jgi:hypothetical protein